MVGSSRATRTAGSGGRRRASGGASPSGAWRRLLPMALVLLAWLAVSGVGGPLVGRLAEVQTNDAASFLPRSAEATEVSELAAGFTTSETLPYFLVLERRAGLTDADRAFAAGLASGAGDLALDVDPAAEGAETGGYRLGRYLAPGPVVPVPSEDGQALLLLVNLDGDAADTVLPGGETPLSLGAQALREAATTGAPAGLVAHVTGPGGVLADLTSAFAGIDGRLLGVALLAVALILLMVYRSPVLPLAVLLTSLFGLSAAALVIYPLADRGIITVDGQAQGILFILVVGAATDYSLLLVARYREELHRHASKHVAMAKAWRASLEPIAASAATVVLGLLCLLLSQLGSTRGLGPVGALGIVGAMLAALTFLPLLLLVPVVLLVLVVAGLAFAIGAAVAGAAAGGVLVLVALGALLAVGLARRRALQAAETTGAAAGARLPWYARPPSGRWLFWPRIPHVDAAGGSGADPVASDGLWDRLARRVGRRPRRLWVATALCLAAAAAFAPTFAASGVSQTDTFRDPVDSVRGQEVLLAHFPGGSGSPAVIIAEQDQAEQVQQVAGAVPGVALVTLTPAVPAEPGAPPSGAAVEPKVVDGRVQLEAVLTPAADSPEAEDVVSALRTELDQVGTDVLVGGSTATATDVRAASDRDLRVIIPAVLVVIFIVLALLLRALVAPLLLILANVLSFAATIGISALVFNHVLDLPGGDPAIPLYGFVFLVALGIDYSIFLMTRVREESVLHGTRAGVLRGLAVTGGVITSAGVVLAATFGALATLPILFLLQIAFIVAFGVLLDTLVVRSLLVPALSLDVGRRIWWPHPLARAGSDEGRRP